MELNKIWRARTKCHLMPKLKPQELTVHIQVLMRTFREKSLLHLYMEVKKDLLKNYQASLMIHRLAHPMKHLLALKNLGPPRLIKM